MLVPAHKSRLLCMQWTRWFHRRHGRAFEGRSRHQHFFVRFGQCHLCPGWKKSGQIYQSPIQVQSDYETSSKVSQLCYYSISIWLCFRSSSSLVVVGVVVSFFKVIRFTVLFMKYNLYKSLACVARLSCFINPESSLRLEKERRSKPFTIPDFKPHESRA